MPAAVGGSGFFCYFQTPMPTVADQRRWRSFWKRLVADGWLQCLRVLDALK